MGQTTMREAAADPQPAATLAGPRAWGLVAPGPMPGSDRRADGHQRQISVSRDCVRIDRRVAGVAMRVAVPVRAYRGVALSLTSDAGGALRYQIALVHRDEDLSVHLDCAGDDLEILADWRCWSRFFRLPALVERRPGQIEDADATLGGLTLGKTDQRRRAPRFRKRRSRFLMRRVAGDGRLTTQSHAGERDIVAPE